MASTQVLAFDEREQQVVLAGQYGSGEVPALPGHSALSNQSEDDGIEARMVRDQIVSFTICTRFVDIAARPQPEAEQHSKQSASWMSACQSTGISTHKSAPKR